MQVKIIKGLLTITANTENELNKLIEWGNKNDYMLIDNLLIKDEVKKLQLTLKYKKRLVNKSKYGEIATIKISKQ